MKPKVLFIVPYPTDQVASQRFRFEQYQSILRETHYCEIHSFYSVRTFSILYKNGHFTQKLTGFLKGYINTLLLLARVDKFDCVFIHREATPLGPPIIEWIIAHVFRKPIIYDFDDAIWLPDDKIKSKTLLNSIKYPGKVAHICRWSHRVSCGNTFLAEYARKYNRNVAVIPTTIDTDNYHIPDHRYSDKLVIGWTGTHSTLPHLSSISSVLMKLSQRYRFITKVICNEKPAFELPNLQFNTWCKTTEIEDLNAIDIGIMPLPNSLWTQGKCGFKLLQYMALEKAAVASAVGVNSEIIHHGQNGLLCQDDSDWYKNLELLLQNHELRIRLGRNGRNTVEKRYSKSSNTDSFLGLFESH